jgi:hypothetical protein
MVWATICELGKLHLLKCTIGDIEDFLAQDGDVDGVVNNEHVVQIHDEEAEGFLKRDNIARHLL